MAPVVGWERAYSVSPRRSVVSPSGNAAEPDNRQPWLSRSQSVREQSLQADAKSAPACG